MEGKYNSINLRIGSRPLPLEGIAQDQREFRQLLRNNAETAVLCLNNSEGTETHVRIAEFHRELEELQDATVELQRIYLQLKRVGKAKARCAELTKQFEEPWKNVCARCGAINERLARYAFRPSLSYGVPGGGEFAMTPDVDWQLKRHWQFKFGNYILTEADAILALLRLDTNGELRKVHLCFQCKARWHVARRSIDRFCSDECREAFYIQSPDYKPRKRENQRKYREQKKRNGRL